MATMVKDDPPVCKYCGNDIPSERQSYPYWDGETCSDECQENLEVLMDESWDDEDDEWMYLDASEREDD